LGQNGQCLQFGGVFRFFSAAFEGDFIAPWYDGFERTGKRGRVMIGIAPIPVIQNQGVMPLATGMPVAGAAALPQYGGGISDSFNPSWELQAAMYIGRTDREWLANEARISQEMTALGGIQAGRDQSMLKGLLQALLALLAGSAKAK
jgi:hypothetical protein